MGLLAGGGFGGSYKSSSDAGGPFGTPFVNNAPFSLFGPASVEGSGATASASTAKTADSSNGSSSSFMWLIAAAAIVAVIVLKK